MTELENELLNEIERVFAIKKHEIKEVNRVENASNHVYSFIVKNKKYIIRKLIETTIMDWRQEKAAYEALKPLNITDELVSFNNGIKIAKYLENSKLLTFSKADQIESLDLMRKVHESGVSIEYDYDIIENIDLVWSLRQYLKKIPDQAEYFRLYLYLELGSIALMAWCLSENNIDGYYEVKKYKKKYLRPFLEYVNTFLYRS